MLGLFPFSIFALGAKIRFFALLCNISAGDNALLPEEIPQDRILGTHVHISFVEHLRIKFSLNSEQARLPETANLNSDERGTQDSSSRQSSKLTQDTQVCNPKF